MVDSSATQDRKLQGHDNKFASDSNIGWNSADSNFPLAWQLNTGIPTQSVFMKPLSFQSLFDSRFWCPYVTVAGDFGLDLIPHQVNPVADKYVQS